MNDAILHIVVLGRPGTGCETRRMLDPMRLRAATFAVTAAGALLAGIGTTVAWRLTSRGPVAGNRPIPDP